MIIVRTKVRIVVRWLIMLTAVLCTFFVTWWLTQHFFYLPHEVPLAVATLVAGSIVNVFGRWIHEEEEKTDRPATANGELNALPGSWVFRIMVDEIGNLAAWIRLQWITTRHRGIALMIPVLVVGLVATAIFVFPRRAQPPVTSPRPPGGPPVATSLASPPAPAEPTMRDGVVSEIVSAETNRCVEVRDFERVENAIIDQGTCQGGANQKFKFLAGVDPGTFKIQAVHSGKCMTVTDDKSVVQLTCADSTQFWRFRWRDTKRNWNYWEIRNTAYGGGLCLELPGYHHDVGTPLQARECNHTDNANNQQWRTYT